MHLDTVVLCSTGLPLAASVPWIGAPEHCDNRVRSVAFISGVANVGSNTVGNDPLMMSYIATQPVLSMVQANQACFILYAGGVLTDPNCGCCMSPENYESTLVVGYGTDNKTNYYRARMNWGTDWGEAGYIRLARGSYIGECGLLQWTGFPVLPANFTG